MSRSPESASLSLPFLLSVIIKLLFLVQEASLKPGLAEVRTPFFLYEITQQASKRLRLVLIAEYRGAMERRATVLSRFAKKSTSYW